MKKIILIIILAIYSVVGTAQKAVAPHDVIEKFYKTTTCVVYNTDMFNIYNDAIKKAVEANWTITPYKFITVTEFEKEINNPEYSFLVLTKVTSDKKNSPAYDFLTLVVGEKKKKFETLPEVCSFPLAYDETDYEEYDYKLGALLLFLQNHIKLTYEHPELNEKNILNYYNKNIQKIGNKTLYLNPDNLAKDVNTIQKISKYYKGNVKLSTPEEIEKIVLNRQKDALILHMVAPPEDNPSGKCYKMIIGADDGQLYYYDAHMVSKNKPPKFLKQDFQKLNKAAK